MNWLFLAAYACSGLAGLVYEVSWTRLLTLYMGHTTAAASTVVAAFMGGLAIGAAGGGRVAVRLTPRQCLYAYAGLEVVVAVAALLLPYELGAAAPVLRWAYGDGAGGWLFPAVRLALCLVLLFVPAAALGATFPLAVRWFLSTHPSVGRAGGTLYAVNTVGAAAGALAAGFLLIPTVGVSGSTYVGLGFTTLAIVFAALVARRATDEEPPQPEAPAVAVDRKHSRSKRAVPEPVRANDPWWLAGTILALSGFASLAYEIAWTRVLALTVGPTTYAFAATLTAFIGGLAIGSGLGAWIAGRTPRPSKWLAVALAAAALSAAVSAALAGGWLPRLVAEQVASAGDSVGLMLSRSAMLVTAMVLPGTVGLGAAFPLALATIGAAGSAARRVGAVYAVNAMAAVAGSLAAGFVLIPMLGLQRTLQFVSLIILVAALVVVYFGVLSARARVAGFLVTAAATAMIVLSPPWDRQLMASGVYKYSPYVADNVDVEAALKAGTLLYYREGAAATVSVKRLTGTMAMAIDGKVDASNGSDMLTQKLLGHLPMLIHEQPKEVAIIGLGSGVTLGAVLAHPVSRVDQIEISPEVVEASRLFANENRNGLDDPRARLIVGDGRSHLWLTPRKYDVIISEPSNPWIAGVAALFTREFFIAARERLAPGGIICQWAHTYNITDADLRSIAATFTSVFPNGTAWLIGQEDVMFIASTEPLDHRLANIRTGWNRPGVAEDLRKVAVADPFALISLFVAGPSELARYGQGAPLQTDDRMALEFSGPRHMYALAGPANATNLAGLLGEDGGPAVVRDARKNATAAEWRDRGAMMLRSDMYAPAYADYMRAVTLSPDDMTAADGLVRAAKLAARLPDARDKVKSLAEANSSNVTLRVALSKLQAATGEIDEGLDTAAKAARLPGGASAGFEQQAAILSTLGDQEALAKTVAELEKVAPERASTYYYAAVASFLLDEFGETVAHALKAKQIDPSYAAIYDLLGAAYTKLGQHDPAREAFETSLRHNARDSTAYTNLGILALQASNREAAAAYFAEALWLDPRSATARDGLAQSRGAR